MSIQNQQHELDRAGTTAQDAQHKILKSGQELAIALAKMMVNLGKAFGKGKGESTTIEIKVDGQTKLKGQVKAGVFSATQNTLTPEEVQSLKAYFATLPNPVLKPKDFEVLVDEKTVLKTENGVVVSQATPAASPSQTEQAKQAFATIQTPPSATAQAQPVPERTVAPTVRTVPPISSSPIETSPLPPKAPIATATPKPTPEPSQTPSAPTPQTNSTDHPLIPSDFGIPAAKGITWDRVKAAGKPGLMHGYGKLESLRADLNDSYRRSNHPGSEWIRKLPHIAPLEKDLEETKQNFEKKLTECIKQGKYPTPTHIAEVPSQEQMNLELLKQGKGLLALLSDRPPGTREWIGKDYALSEGKDGSFRVTHQSRGEILSYSNGKVTGTATAQDVEKLNNLLSVAKQTHIPQSNQGQSQPKAVARGGIKA